MQVRATLEDRYDEVLTDGAMALVGRLHEELDARRRELLEERLDLQSRLDAGESLDFTTAPEDFTVAPVPDALQDRRVEITGPTSRKMVINALNSGARGFMADFEDSNSPYWSNMVGGQVNLADAIRGRSSTTRRASTTSSRTTRPCCTCGRAACTCPRRTSSSRASRWRARSWTSGCTCTGTPRRCSSAAGGRTSTSRSSSRSRRRRCGATRS